MMKTGLSLLVLLVAVQVATCYYFDNYVFAQQWPGAFCFSKSRKAANETSKLDKSLHHHHHPYENCELAQNITGWTVHGLWPSVNESYPEYCNRSWKLEESVFSDLEDDMRARWPSLAIPRNDFSFWDHEWSKHGTCAATVPSLYGPERFFKQTLQFNTNYNPLALLSTKNISPTDAKCYDYSDVLNAVKSLYNDENVMLGCVWDSENREQLLAQIEICLDKSFRLKCAPTFKHSASFASHPGMKDMPQVEPCSASKSLCYRPIRRLN